MRKEDEQVAEKVCMQDEIHAKLLQKEKAENEETKGKLNTSAAKKQMAMANEINDLKAKVLTTVPKAIYILSLTGLRV